MEIKGFIDMSLVDWDDRVSSVIFLPRCTFRCPFCYNVALVLKPDELPTIDLAEIEAYLRRHRGAIDGIVITGGEPTVHDDLPDLCRRLKEMGFSVKIDTNGTNPNMVKRLIDEGLVDYIAMDVKAPLNEFDYSRAAGIDVRAMLPRVRETINILMKSNIEYEFRTTLVPTIHKKGDVEKICKLLMGCRRYVLQRFMSEVETINPKFKELKPFSDAEMKSFLEEARRYIPNAKIR